MPIIQTRRRFINSVALAGAAGLLRPGRAWAAEPALETTTVRLGRIAGHLFRPAVCLRGVAARRGVYRRPLHRHDSPNARGRPRARQVRFRTQTCRFGTSSRSIASCRSPSSPACMPAATSCSPMAASAASPTSKGSAWAGDPQLLSLIAAYVGLDPKKDLTLVDVFGAEGVDLFTEGKLDAYMAFPPEVAGVARAQGRPSDPPDRRGPALVAVFLLHDGGEPGVCRTIPGGDEARDPRRPESRRSVRRRAGSGGAADRRGRLHRTL